jgi:peptide-methionine (S)-S-oxide reductase
MPTFSSPFVGAIAGLSAAMFAFFSSGAGAQGQPAAIKTVADLETAVFAGGCFWCVEADFDKVDGVIETVSGYTGGQTDDPTYRTHSRDGHLEAVRVSFDSARVSFEELVEYFFRHIDPTDAGGQFCDRGNSYKTAIFARDDTQADIARSEKQAIDAAGLLDRPVVTAIRGESAFYPAEDYHQDYYRKQPVKYAFYRKACGRDDRLEEIWGRDSW